MYLKKENVFRHEILQQILYLGIKVKDQLFRINRSQLWKWLFGSFEKQAAVPELSFITNIVLDWMCVCDMHGLFLFLQLTWLVELKNVFLVNGNRNS